MKSGRRTMLKMTRITAKLISLVLLYGSTVCLASGQSLGKKIVNWISGTPYEATGTIPTTHTTLLLGVGQVGTIDSYLSESAHTGLLFQFLSMVDYPPIHEGPWHIYMESNLQAGMPKNKANGSVLYLIGGRYSLAGAYRALRWKGVAVDVAPMATLQAQGNLKTSNVNNVGNVKAGLGLDAWARVRYRLPIEAMPIAIQYSMRMPMVGIGFQPDYGQSYYDYVSGENNAPIKLHLTSFHNHWHLDQRFVLDLPIRNLTISLGAEYSFTDEKNRSLHFQQGQWTALLGVALDLFTLSGNKSARSSNIKRSID